jgi:adenylate cyclase
VRPGIGSQVSKAGQLDHCYHRRVASRRTLERLLDRRNDHPEQLAQIDATIRAQFEQTRAILVLDMCGFSRLTTKHGIVHYLSMIRRMQRVVLPRIEAQSGRVMKTEADNVFGVFDDVPHAVAAGRSVLSELADQNRNLPEDWDVHVGIGIGYGPLLMVGDHDAYGTEMNYASKLGEDLAEAGDLLLTEAAWLRLKQQRRGFKRRLARISGVRFTYYSATSRSPARR